jgi:hypothetical protein
MAKQRTEKFLQKFNESTKDKCLIVVGDMFKSKYEVLGVGAHPNYLGWLFDYKSKFQDIDGLDEMFHFNQKRATELVLTTTSLLAFATLAFIARKIAAISAPLELLEENPYFRHHEDDLERVASIGAISELMMLMLMKWINRTKPNFDPELHF